MYYKTTPYRIFNAFNILILGMISLLCILPLVHTLAISLSGKAPANANLIGLVPIDFTWDAYAKTLNNPDFLRALAVAVQRTVIGTGFGMLVVFLAAFPLSRPDSAFRSRTYYSWFFIITLLFNGGLIPTYIVVQKLGLMNSIWSLILPVSVNIWLLILMMSFLRNIPKELEEAATIDGAGNFRILFRIFLPISMPAVATLALFTMVNHWNSWFDAMIYISDVSKYPLSTFLQTILVQIDTSQMSSSARDMDNISNKTVKAAQIFIGALPILIVYPFMQKYFVKGMVLGAIKE